MTANQPTHSVPAQRSTERSTVGDRLDRPAFRLQLVMAAHRDTILWLAAEAERWRWEAERLRGENVALRKATT